MGLFNKLFNSANEVKENDALPWIPLTTLDQLLEIEEASKVKTQLVFKHSTRCGISRMVLKQFEADYKFTEEDFDLYYLDLLNFREISNEIAIKFGVIHESPQLLIIKNTETVGYESHGGINDLDLIKFI